MLFFNSQSHNFSRGTGFFFSSIRQFLASFYLTFCGLNRGLYLPWDCLSFLGLLLKKESRCTEHSSLEEEKSRSWDYRVIALPRRNSVESAAWIVCRTPRTWSDRCSLITTSMLLAFIYHARSAANSSENKMKSYQRLANAQSSLPKKCKVTAQKAKTRSQGISGKSECRDVSYIRRL